MGIILSINSLEDVNLKASQVPPNTITTDNIEGFNCLKIENTALVIPFSTYQTPIMLEGWFYSLAGNATVFRSSKTGFGHDFSDGDYTVGGVNSVYGKYVSNSVIPTSKWYNAKLVISEGKLRFYIDDQLADTERIVGNIASNNIMLGNAWGASNSYMRDFVVRDTIGQF